MPDASYSVQVTCDDKIVRHLVVRQSGTALELGFEQGFNYQGVTVSAEVHMPAAASVNLKGVSCGTSTADLRGCTGTSAFVSGASRAYVNVGPDMLRGVPAGRQMPPHSLQSSPRRAP
jgi:hypothetical protein